MTCFAKSRMRGAREDKDPTEVRRAAPDTDRVGKASKVISVEVKDDAAPCQMEAQA